MRTWVLLTWKNLRDARAMLLLSAVALFGLSWLSVYVTGRIEARFARTSDPRDLARRQSFLRGMGGNSMDFSSAAIEMAWWNHPFIVLTIAAWSITRGTAAVSAEIERGTLDLIVSRPVPRWSYLLSHVSAAVLGLVLLMTGLVLGNLVGTQYNRVLSPPGVVDLILPGWHLGCLGFAMFGYTIVLSAWDIARWRPALIASVWTLASLIAPFLAQAPGMEDWKWIESLSVFKGYNPVDSILEAESLAYNTTILCLVGLTGVVGALIIFQRRDLPSSS